MRRTLLLAVGLTSTAGCFAPFSWPDRRPPAEATVTALGSAVVDVVPPIDPSYDSLPMETEPASVPAADALALAAACLDRGDDAGALPHLKAHVSAYPDAIMMRAYLAELLFKLGRPVEARAEFERVTVDAPETGPVGRQLVHCHTRLMELALESGDEFAEELHRGVGLVLLVRQWSAEPGGADERLSQQTLAKAVAALRSARDRVPTDPRPAVYLAEAYDGLGQSTAARSQRRAARSGVPDLGLSAGERDRMWQP